VIGWGRGRGGGRDKGGGWRLNVGGESKSGVVGIGEGVGKVKRGRVREGGWKGSGGEREERVRWR